MDESKGKDEEVALMINKMEEMEKRNNERDDLLDKIIIQMGVIGRIR